MDNIYQNALNIIKESERCRPRGCVIVGPTGPTGPSGGPTGPTERLFKP